VNLKVNIRNIREHSRVEPCWARVSLRTAVSQSTLRMSHKNVPEFWLLPQNHISLIGVAVVGTKNYVIVTGTEHANEYMKDHILEFESIGSYFL